MYDVYELFVVNNWLDDFDFKGTNPFFSKSRIPPTGAAIQGQPILRSHEQRQQTLSWALWRHWSRFV